MFLHQLRRFRNGWKRLGSLLGNPQHHAATQAVGTIGAVIKHSQPSAGSLPALPSVAKTYEKKTMRKVPKT